MRPVSPTGTLLEQHDVLLPDADAACVQDDHGKVHGVHVQDNLTGSMQAVYARQVCLLLPHGCPHLTCLLLQHSSMDCLAQPAAQPVCGACCILERQPH